MLWCVYSRQRSQGIGAPLVETGNEGIVSGICYYSKKYSAWYFYIGVTFRIRLFHPWPARTLTPVIWYKMQIRNVEDSLSNESDGPGGAADGYESSAANHEKPPSYPEESLHIAA